MGRSSARTHRGLVIAGLALVAACSQHRSGTGSQGSSPGATQASGGETGGSGATASAGSSADAGGADADATGGMGAGSGNAGTGGATAGAGGTGTGGISGSAGAGSAGAGSGGGGGGGGGGMSGSAGAGAPAQNALPSAGCGAASPPDSGRFMLEVSGTTREYILKLPAGYDPSTPYPLIFAWHGGRYNADWVANGDPPQTGPYFGIESEAAGRAIFVAPQALSSSWTNQNGRDIAFADAMRTQLESVLCIDQGRIFSVGFSMGALMTIAIGCEEGDLFRAIAPMSGSLADGCPAKDQPIAYWGSHGNNDTTIAPADGQAARDEFLKRNHCGTGTVPIGSNGCLSYQGCDPGYPVTWCPFDGVHEPPKFAGPEIWSFLSQL